MRPIHKIDKLSLELPKAILIFSGKDDQYNEESFKLSFCRKLDHEISNNNPSKIRP